MVVRDQALANTLIPETIANARKIPFYIDFWRDVELDQIKSVVDLTMLPLLQKPELEEFLSSFQHTCYPALVSHTSGTSGSITLRCRSTDEIRALQSIRSAQLNVEFEGVRPLSLSIEGANHGHMIAMPSSVRSLKAVGFDHSVIDHVQQQLLRSYSFPGFSTNIKVIDAPLGFVKMLGLNLIEQGIEPKSLGIDLISTYGEHLTPYWLERLQETWDANILDRYATSEAIGGATKCERCGYFTFHPESWPEVIDINTGVSLSSGIGMLAMTELFPFSQLQPMIRFCPGDLFEIKDENCDGHSTRTFRFLGRHDRALIDHSPQGDTILLYPSEVEDCLDQMENIQREDTFHTLALERHHKGLAKALCSLRLNR
jgi:phenylacetate-coenzyme A ligase PaaK-like adenylate-forming protein